ncbi:MAG: hypothetical protein BIFFINMI_02807 [Phycisphaerae bacterium]|nr:hypothetical protein [Phycisphaerae bacterium]
MTKRASVLAAAVLWAGLYGGAAFGQPAPTPKPTNWQQLSDADFVTWVNDKTEWQGRTPYDQVAMVARLNRLGQAGQGARDKMKSYVATNDFADAAKVGKVGVEGAGLLARAFSGVLTAQEKTAWAGSVRQAFVADAAALGKLTFNQVGHVAATLDELGDANAGDVWSQKVQQAGGWQGLSSVELQVVAGRLKALGASGKAARGKLIQQLNDHELADDATAKKMGLQTWQAVIQPIDADVPGKMRVAWILRLKNALAPGERVSTGYMHSLEASLTSMKDVDAAGRAEAAQAAGQQLADKAVAQSAGPELCRMLARSLAPDLSAQAKGQWAASLKAAFVTDEQAVADLDRLDVANLVDALQVLDDAGAPAVWSAWVGKSAKWRSLSTDQLTALIGQIKGAQAASACQTVVAYLDSDLIKDEASAVKLSASQLSNLITPLAADVPAAKRVAWALRLKKAFGQGAPRVPSGLWAVECKLALMEGADAAGKQQAAGAVGGLLGDKAVAQAAGPELCLLLVKGLAADLTDAVKAQWAAGLKAAFVTDKEAVAGMEFADVQNVGSALGLLNDQAATVWPAWVENSDNWQSLAVAQLTSLAGTLRAQGAAGAAARQKLIAYLTAARMADKAKVQAVGMSSWEVFVTHLVQDMNAGTKMVWATRLEEAFKDAQGPTAGAAKAKLLNVLKILRAPAK